MVDDDDCDLENKDDIVDLGSIIMRIIARETGVRWPHHLPAADQSARKGQ